MRIHVISDLHLEFAPYEPRKVDCDLVVLAGDIDLKLRGIEWALRAFPEKPVLYVFGNHEFYGERWPRLIEKGRALTASTNVHILENDVFELKGYRFWGATLWSDFAITGDVSESVQKARLEVNDFKRIRVSPSSERFLPSHARQAHSASLDSLRRFLSSGDRKKSVVVTHHAPSLRSVPEKFRTDPTSGSFASDLEAVVAVEGPALWIHGHIHDRCEYQIGGTTVLSNTRGYPGEWGFDQSLIYELKQLPEMWAKALESGEAAKPLIEKRSGPSLSIAEVAKLLKLSEQAAHQLIKEMCFVAYPSLYDGRLRFPGWQFSEEHCEALPWVETVILAYGSNGWGLIDFLTVPRVPGNLSYLGRLSCGQMTLTDLISAAQRVVPS